MSTEQQSIHPPTVELAAFTTKELVFEILLYQSAKEAGDETMKVNSATDKRFEEAKAELARRYKRGWIATGKRVGPSD